MQMFKLLSISFERDGALSVKRPGASGSGLSGCCSYGGNIKLEWMIWWTGSCPYSV